LLDKGETLLLKGFKVDHETTSGQLVFDPDFHLKLMRTVAKTGNVEVTGRKICPKCKNGFLLKGKKAYGCSNYNKGCDFVYPFEKLRNILKDQTVTEELVYKVLSESH
jgi:DNA topoisomerase-3